MNRKSYLTLLSMILILTFMLTGCSSPTPTAPTAAPAQPTAVPAARRTDRRPCCRGTDRSPGCARTDRGPRTHRGSRPVSKYKEAPMLAELVKAGKLPPVDQRLPENPLVVEAAEDRPVRRRVAPRFPRPVRLQRRQSA